MMQIEENDLKFIGECFLKDIDINDRLDKNSRDTVSISKLVQLFTSYTKNQCMVYTAFDGDHFHLLQYMRKCVLEANKYPANPESILGYRNVVTRYQNKYGVLLDDLAILQNCDELWVFTDNENSIKETLNLPEGVLVELAFYLKRHSTPTVNFISIKSLLYNGETVINKLSITFEDIEKELISSNRKEIIDMANNDFKIDKDLKSLVFFITDPLDFKYSEWLREERSANTDEIALVPGLASKISDAEYGLKNIGNIILSWAILLRRLSKKRAYFLDSFDERRSPSVIAEALKQYCIQVKGPKYLENRKWTAYNIPKSIQKDKWPITLYEAKILNK
jgi:hypothetical protein